MRERSFEIIPWRPLESGPDVVYLYCIRVSVVAVDGSTVSYIAASCSGNTIGIGLVDVDVVNYPRIVDQTSADPQR